MNKFGKLQLEPLLLLKSAGIDCIHLPGFLLLVSLLLRSLNVTCCYIRAYMIFSNRVACVTAANNASCLVLQLNVEGEAWILSVTEWYPRKNSKTICLQLRHPWGDTHGARCVRPWLRTAEPLGGHVITRLGLTTTCMWSIKHTKIP